MSASTAGHARLARRFPQSLHIIYEYGCQAFNAVETMTSAPENRSKIRSVQRVDVFIKVEVELDEDEKPERVAKEICRQVEKIYVVRRVELSSMITRD